MLHIHKGTGITQMISVPDYVNTHFEWCNTLINFDWSLLAIITNLVGPSFRVPITNLNITSDLRMYNIFICHYDLLMHWVEREKNNIIQDFKKIVNKSTSITPIQLRLVYFLVRFPRRLYLCGGFSLLSCLNIEKKQNHLNRSYYLVIINFLFLYDPHFKEFIYFFISLIIQVHHYFIQV